MKAVPLYVFVNESDPNSVTSTEQPFGKSTTSVIVIDGVEYVKKGQ